MAATARAPYRGAILRRRAISESLLRIYTSFRTPTVAAGVYRSPRRHGRAGVCLNMYVNVRTYIHAFMHACIHTYIRTYIHIHDTFTSRPPSVGGAESVGRGVDGSGNVVGAGRGYHHIALFDSEGGRDADLWAGEQRRRQFLLAQLAAIGVASRGVPGGRLYCSKAIFCFCKNK